MTRTRLVALGLLAMTGCSVHAGTAARGGAKADLENWPEQLADRKDPIANWLRDLPRTERGSIVADYESLTLGAGATLGCDASTLSTFVISDGLVTPEGRFPRLVSTMCGVAGVSASRLFVSAPFRSTGTPDIDPTSLEILAWDASTREYRSYATVPVAGHTDEVMIEVEPERCRSCHLGPKDLDTAAMRMLPVMNELSAPWQHWSAEPGFRSVDCDIPAETVAAPHYSRLAGGERLGAAPALEQIIRAAIGEVNTARLATRRAPASLTAAMALLRPLFCDEQVNYVTADASSGLMPMQLAVRPGLREAFRATGTTTWPWHWFQDGELTVPPTNTAPDAFAMVPVRASSDADYENRMATIARSLTPSQILRVHALDWKGSLFSEARCGLWTGANERFLTTPPDLENARTVQEALPVIFEAIMPIRPASDGRVIALAAAEPGVSLAETFANTTVVADCSTDTTPCDVDLETFGGLVEAQLLAINIDALANEAQMRRCLAQRKYENAPAMPGLENCPRARGGPDGHGYGPGGRRPPDPFVPPGE